MSASLTLALALLSPPQHEVAPDGYAPRVEAASEEGPQALQRMRLPEGWTRNLWAQEPHLANAVCLYVDHKGRVWVAESFRVNAGVTDMRSHMDWLEDELAATTVEDRVAYMRARTGEGFAAYESEHDRIRLLVDEDGDGACDRSTVYADGFHGAAEGIGAGLLVRGEEVWFTCIPDLWRLRDLDADGVADERESVHTGFGVKIALLGHDMHGLRVGLDGRLYFSIGDRGLNVQTEGKHFVLPDRGAVLRCELDGTNLELYATGLRNPQELAFDERGDLFTGDNNSDGGDQARWVYVVPGGDTGWRHHYQYVNWPNARGPWNAEGQWKPFHGEQPWFLTPPIANVGSGPSGLARVPDQGWGELAGAFMLCDFRGGAQWSSIMAVRHEPHGAGFQLVSAEPLIKDLLPTDCDFGPDGTLYISDWVNGWGMTGKGRVFQVAPPGHGDTDAVAEVEGLLAEGMRGRSGRELQRLLLHASFDVRLEAQLELVGRAVAAPAGSEVLRESVGLLLEVAREAREHPLARLHGIWGAQAVARQRPLLSGIGGSMVPLLEDADPEVRIQALRALGELGEAAAVPFVERALLADGRRERAAALRSLATAPTPQLSAVALERVLAVIEEDAAGDPWLRSEAIHALEAATRAELVGLLSDPRSAVRRCAVVALRRRSDPEIARALTDVEPEVAAEAARAIHEVPIPEAAPALAAWLGVGGAKAYDHRRAMAAARELHRAEDALAIARFLQEEGRGPRLVEEGLRFLAEWGNPSPVDPVIGSWRPVVGQPLPAEIDVAALLAAARRAGRGALEHWLRLEAGAASEATAALRGQLARDAQVHEEVRAEALRGLVGRGAPGAADLAEALLEDGAGAVAAAALEALSRTDPERAVAALALRAAEGEVGARQAAIRSLATVQTHGAAAQLARLLRAEVSSAGSSDAPSAPPSGASSAPPPGASSAVALELLEALAGRQGEEVQAALEAWSGLAAKDPLGARAARLRAGGQVEEGRRVFLEKAEVSCLRCHRVGEQGVSEVGPRLDGVASRLSQGELLQSILEPNAALAEGYQSWIFALTDGTVLVGRIVEEDGQGVVVLDAEGQRHELAADEIDARRKDVSAMPADLAEKLSDRELRDLVAFLENLRDS